jgi:periplasmic protein CpxP/Spy
MKLNKWMTAVAVLTLGTSLAVAAPNEGGFKAKHRRDHRGMHAQKFAEKLNLTEAQKDQIKQIRQNNREQNKAFFETARATRQELRAAKKANDTAKVESLKATLKAQREQFQQIRQTERTQILAILTPEQKAQFEAMKAERGERHGKHRGR